VSLCGLAACDAPRQISPNGTRAYELSLANFGDRLGAAWHGGEDDRDEIFMRFTDTDAGLGQTLELTDGARNAYEPDLEAFEGDALLGWYEEDRNTHLRTALLGRFTRQGKRVWVHEISTRGMDARNPVVRLIGKTLAVAWLETHEGTREVWSARYDDKGEVLHAAQRVGRASTETWNLNAAVDDGGVFYVVFDAQLGTKAKELSLVRIADDRAEQLPLSADDGFNSSYPDIAIDRGRVAVTWFDERDGNQEVYLFAGKLDQLGPDIATNAHRITRTPGPSIGAYVTWNAGRIGLAWCDTIIDHYEIYTQSFDPAGNPLADAIRLTHGELQSVIPAIRPWHGGFAIAWNSYARRATEEARGGVTSSKAMLAVVETH
jgi:hypothetical protein